LIHGILTLRMGDLNYFEEGVAWMSGYEGDVVCWVIVAGSDFKGEGEVQEFVDGVDDVSATRDGEGSVLELFSVDVDM
jgi:hypothetical protein